MKEGVFCTVKDLPTWAQEAVKKHLGLRSRPLCEVKATEIVKLGTPWHDGCVRHLIGFRNNVTEEISAAYGDTFFNHSKKEQLAYLGSPIPLQEGCMLLEVLNDPPSAILYVHPKNVAPFLPNHTELDDLELKTLCIIEGLISRARKELFEIYGIGDEVFARLEKKGLITKSKAIIIRGRNAISHVDPHEKQEICSPSFELRMNHWRKGG